MVSMAIPSKTIYRLNASLTKIESNGIFHRTRADNSKICMKTQNNLGKNSRAVVSFSLTSDYTTKLQSIKPYSTGKKKKKDT